MNISNVLGMRDFVQSNIGQSINDSNGVSDNFNFNRQVSSIDSFSLGDDQSMNRLMNQIGLQVQRRGGN